jgi:ComEC/Rec2-related protein
LNQFNISLRDSFIQNYHKHPAFIALVLFSIGFVCTENIYYTILVSIILTIINHRYRFVFWWGILFFFAGLYSAKLENQKNAYWKQLNNSKGYSELHFEWDEDVKVIDDTIKGWAWIMPLRNKIPYSQYKIRKWVIAYPEGDLPTYAAYKFTSWKSNIANASVLDRRNFKCIIKNSTIESSNFARIRAGLQIQCHKIWSENFSSSSTALLCSLAFGNRQYLSQKSKNNFMRLGLLPLLALSGMHVGIIFMCFRFLFKKIIRWENLSNCCALIAVLSYGFLGGMSYSLKRATMMCIIFAVSRLLGKRYNLFNALSFLALVEIVLFPDIIYSLAFQLSYLGVAGIAWVFKINSLFKKATFKKKNRIKSFIFDAYIVSWGAMLFTWPICVIYFKTIPILSWLFSIPMTIVFSVVIFNVMVIFFLTLLFSSLPIFLTYPLSLYNQSIDNLSNIYSWIIVWDNVNAHYAWLYYLSLLVVGFSATQHNRLYMLKMKVESKKNSFRNTREP